MKCLAFPALVMAMLLAGGAAMAQSPNGLVGGSQFNPPLPPPPPPPSLAVPVVPKMDVPSPQNVPDVPRESFSDRISGCLDEDEGAAAGLGPADRAAYSRACANR
jgi:hypothetical protein